MSNHYERYCVKCGSVIVMKRLGGKRKIYKPFNLDESPHRCLSPVKKLTKAQRKKFTPQEKPLTEIIDGDLSKPSL